MPTDTATDNSNGGHSSAEIPSSQACEVSTTAAAEANTHGHTHAGANTHTTLTSSLLVQPQIPYWPLMARVRDPFGQLEGMPTVCQGLLKSCSWCCPQPYPAFGHSHIPAQLNTDSLWPRPHLCPTKQTAFGHAHIRAALNTENLASPVPSPALPNTSPA